MHGIFWGLNGPIIHRRICHYQIATALQWQVTEIAEDFHVSIRPQDLVDNQLHARLDSPLQMVLIDVEFHEPAPSWNVERLRYTMNVLPVLTAKQFTRALSLSHYCDYATLPCMRWRNAQYWGESEPAATIAHGDYLRIVLPPPNPEQSMHSARCLAATLHMGFSRDSLEMAAYVIDDAHIQNIPNPYRIMTYDDIISDEEMALFQLSLTSPKLNPCPHAGPGARLGRTPRIQATLGHHNACTRRQTEKASRESAGIFLTLELSDPLDRTRPPFACTLLSPPHAGPKPLVGRTPRIQATLGTRFSNTPV